MIINKQLNKMIICNVNERIVLSTQDTLLTQEQIRVEENTVGMFNITCSGATLSMDKKFIAIGDFTGNIKVFEIENSMNTKLIKECSLFHI